uniref:SHSP domain-containing protein n=1 Tax=Schistosoma mansoni TaxID=6183 RepID=A0A3Q0KMU8_SCHMA
MANYRTELRIPVERNNKSIADDDYFKFDDPSMVTLNDNWKYNSNNTNNWDSRSRHTSNSEQISHDIPWYKRLRTTSADPMRYTDTDYLYDDMKRRMEERRRRWNEEFKLLHNDILLPSRLKSSNDLFNSRETINSSSSHDIISKNPSSNSGYEQFPDGSVHFVSNFNLSGYDPELLKVFVRDGKLMVVAKTGHNHSTNSLNTTMNTNNSNNNSISSFREYTHSINLPPGVDDEKLSAVLSLNGILTVSCPMKPPSFISSTNLQSPYSDHLSNSLWNNHHQHYRHHYQSPSIKSQQQQQYSRKFDLKSPKFNHSARSSHSDYDIISHDQQDYHSRHPSSLIQQPRKHRFRLELPIDSEYSPGEIQIKTLNRRIYIKARHEERALNRTSVREFSKEYDIPDNIDPESLTAKFSNGILYIEEPIV